MGVEEEEASFSGGSLDPELTASRVGGGPSIYLGSKGWVRKNWEGVSQVVESRMKKWRCLLSQVSYRGRVLIINNLAASSLCQKRSTLNPPVVCLWTYRVS